MFIELKHNQEIFRYLPEIWQAEESFPQTHRDASHTWTKNENEFQEFVESCDLVYAWFEENRLQAVVYCQEEQSALNVHLSILYRNFNVQDLVVKLRVLRDELLQNHTTCLMAWILKRNPFIQKIIEQIGFVKSNLTMKHGRSRNKVLEWCLYRIIVDK